jgi:dipeptidyl aminopeptidase/acylaminoacyl peptidase
MCSVPQAAVRTAVFLSLLAIPVASTAARPVTVDEFLKTRRIDDPQLSPDGKWITFTVRQKSVEENRDVKDVWIMPAAGGTPRPFTRDGRSEHARWSPDGSQLLVVGGETPQLYLYDRSGGDRRALTSVHGGAEDGIWSPDGRLVAFTTETYPECVGDGAAIDACNRKKAEDRAGSKVNARVIDHLFARHWSSWLEGKRRHVFVIPVGGGAPKDLTPGESDWPTWSLGGTDPYSFTPDGKQIVVASKPSKDEAWSTNGDIWEIPTAGGSARNLTSANPGDDSHPRISPDGRWLAYLAQVRNGYESDQWKLKLLDRKSGRLSDLGSFEDSIEHFSWRHDSKGLVTALHVRGRVHLMAISIEGRVSSFSTDGGDDFTLAPDGSALVVASAMNRPPELFRLAPGRKPQALTALNAETFAGIDLGPKPEELWVQASDGVKVHSWVLRPPGLAEGKKAPLLVLIHGGPQGAWMDTWHSRWNTAVFAGRGYVVVAPNPRGSIGYGQKFVEQVSRDWGGLAYDDIMRSVDAAERLPYVEVGHTCAAGASYGGYMVDWIAGHTQRFKCLVSHDGVFDLVSDYGSTEELWFPEFEFGGPYWEAYESYRKWSPSSFVQNFKTPTLVVQGELDFRVGTEQGLGMFTALQRRGVESRLLWFPDEGHFVLKPRNVRLWYQTMLDWIDAHAKKTGASSGRAASAAQPPH